MTNEQIIQDIAVQIYGFDAVDQFLCKGDIPLHTAQGWHLRGFIIKKDEHGIACRLWKKVRKKSSSEEEQEVESNNDFCLCKAYLFRQDQVERMKNKP